MGKEKIMLKIILKRFFFLKLVKRLIINLLNLFKFLFLLY